jgi:AcrR family transcriptional regulator
LCEKYAWTTTGIPLRKVDHDSRREEVASAASRLIADRGLEALTTRALAKELGCSIGVLSHYFNSKEEIVLAAFQWADQSIDQRMQAAIVDQDKISLNYFIPMIQAGLPLDEASDREWRVRFNLYNYCLTRGGAGLSAQIDKTNHFRDLMVGLISALQEKGEVRQDISAELITKLAFDMVMGAAQNLLLVPMAQRRDHARYLFDIVEQLRPKSSTSPTAQKALEASR